MNTNIKIFLWVTNITFIKSIAVVPPNLKVAGMAFNHDIKGGLLFGAAAIFTQITAASLALLLISRRGQLSKINLVIVIVSILTTAALGLRYLSAGNEDVFYFSGLTAQCAFVILTGIFMTLLSTVRVPFLQDQISYLQCRQWIKNNKASYGYYIIGVSLGAILSAFLYFGIGYSLSGHVKGYQHFFNIAIGVLLLGVSLKRLSQLIMQLTQSREEDSKIGQEPSCS